MANIPEYKYISPKKSMRGENCVSFIDVDINNVANGAKNTVINSNISKSGFGLDLFFMVQYIASRVIIRVGYL
jgi:hypothetical protein